MSTVPPDDRSAESATVTAMEPAAKAKEAKAEGGKGQKQDSHAGAAATGDAPKKLTGAELKALKQADKAKRRAAIVAAKGAGAPAAGAKGAAQAGQLKQAAGGGRSKQDGAGAGAETDSSSKFSGPLPWRPSAATSAVATAGGAGATAIATGRAVSAAVSEKDARSGIPECFSHLPMAKRIPLNQAHKDVHPAVLAVGQQMASFVLRDNMARLEATLVAFKKVIEAYQTPPGNAFSRHFVSHVLNPQIEYLTECRPMCFAMGNAIRLLKARVSQLDLDMDEKDAIEDLCEALDLFIQERIYAAAVGIAREAASLIEDHEVLLTYGAPPLVCAALEQVWATGRQFDLIVVDDQSNSAASEALAKRFRHRQQQQRQQQRPRQDVHVTYCPSLDGIDYHIASATKVLLGAEAVFANGALLAPAGTCDVALAADAQGCPVVALCETVNFDRDRVATDALAYNEIDPDCCGGDTAFRLLFDTTEASLVSMLICEYEESSGSVPAHAISQVLRSREDPN